jgi:3-hydroxybutyryl-CoA dehydrogenase
MKYDKVGVVGAGVIGRSVAQSLAQTGHQVVLVDLSTSVLDGARKAIADGLRLAAFSEPALRKVNHAEIISRIKLTTDYSDLADVGFVVENTTEEWAIKEAAYRTLDLVCRADCVFAANTSAIPIARIAEVTTRAPLVIGMHFMNPVPLKPVVEVIVSRYTDDVAIQAAHALLGQLGKKAIVVRDNSGFVSNRVMMLMINEAIAVLEDGTASAADVDAIFVSCFAHAMGPLATADLIGLDTILRTLDVLREHRGDAKFDATPLLRRMVQAGSLGRKTGSGFFEYNKKMESENGR